MSNINLKFKVQEPASFFHILDSVSQWDIHTRGSIREYYEAKFGLSKQDNKYIKQYVKIRHKYSWKQLDSDFIPAKNFKEVDANLRKRLTGKEFIEMKGIVGHFYPQIHKIYLEFHNDLEKRRRYLDKEAGIENINSALREIKHFYESDFKYPSIYVHLLVNPDAHRGGGGANVRPGIHITIEPVNLKSEQIENVRNSIPVMVHEALHLIEACSDKDKWEDFRKKVTEKGLDFRMLKEAIADTLFPDGVLAMKYKMSRMSALRYKNSRYPKKGDSDRIVDILIRRKLAGHLYKLTERQLKESKTIFEGNYLDNCIKKFQIINRRIKHAKK